jgi:hypothetical protein
MILPKENAPEFRLQLPYTDIQKAENSLRTAAAALTLTTAGEKNMARAMIAFHSGPFSVSGPSLRDWNDVFQGSILATLFPGPTPDAATQWLS